MFLKQGTNIFFSGCPWNGSNKKFGKIANIRTIWRGTSVREGEPSFLARERNLVIGIKPATTCWTESSTIATGGRAFERTVMVMVMVVVRATAAAVVDGAISGGAKRGSRGPEVA